MRLEIVVACILLGFVLYWKYGKKIQGDELHGLWGSAVGLLGKFKLANNPRRELFALLIGIAIAAWFAEPKFYTIWVANNKVFVAITVTMIVFYFALKPPKSRWFLYLELFILMGIGATATLPPDLQKEVRAWRPWPDWSKHVPTVSEKKSQGPQPILVAAGSTWKIPRREGVAEIAVAGGGRATKVLIPSSMEWRLKEEWCEAGLMVGVRDAYDDSVNGNVKTVPCEEFRNAHLEFPHGVLFLFVLTPDTKDLTMNMEFKPRVSEKLRF